MQHRLHVVIARFEFGQAAHRIAKCPLVDRGLLARLPSIDIHAEDHLGGRAVVHLHPGLGRGVG
jgi:hypothetical protein